MNITRTASRKAGYKDKVDLMSPKITINQDSFSFDLMFTAKQFGDNSSEYKYTLHGDFIELLDLMKNNHEFNKYQIEQRNLLRAKLFKMAVDAEVQKQLSVKT